MPESNSTYYQEKEWTRNEHHLGSRHCDLYVPNISTWRGNKSKIYNYKHYKLGYGRLGPGVFSYGNPLDCLQENG